MVYFSCVLLSRKDGFAAIEAATHAAQGVSRRSGRAGDDEAHCGDSRDMFTLDRRAEGYGPEWTEGGVREHWPMD